MLLTALLVAAAVYALVNELLKRRLCKEKASDPGWTAFTYSTGGSSKPLQPSFQSKASFRALLLAQVRPVLRPGESAESAGSPQAGPTLGRPPTGPALRPRRAGPAPGRSRCEGGQTSQSRMEKDLELQGNDAVAVQGGDAAGNQVQVRMARRSSGRMELWLLLRVVDEEGRVLTPSLPSPSEWPSVGTATVFLHPIHPDGLTLADGGGGWSAAGLCFEPLEASRSWRLSYRGMLRSR